MRQSPTKTSDYHGKLGWRVTRSLVSLALGVWLYRQAAEVMGYSKPALKVLPHGVFELPALLIAASYGLWLGVMVVRRMRGRESTPLRSHIEPAFRRYFAVVFPLLIVAAGIETALVLVLQ